MEIEYPTPHRMIIKIDIKKAFDSIEWVVILSTLKIIGFLAVWIKWIDSCLSLASFIISINGHNSPWFTNSRGVRQGDPVSPLLYLLVSENLYAILNKALSLNLVPDSNCSLTRNFNHLMFVDDLILITVVSRKLIRMFSSA